MTIERSHGKARPTLPRSSDLADVQAVPNPTAGRGPGGRFAPGNRTGVAAREKNAAKKLLGPNAGDDVALAIARDARKLFAGCLRELPHQGANVRSLVALRARHEAVAAYYAAKAAELGLDTTEGQAADDRAAKHGQRAERLAVTALDIATKLAARVRPEDMGNVPWLMPDDEEPASKDAQP